MAEVTGSFIAENPISKPMAVQPILQRQRSQLESWLDSVKNEAPYIEFASSLRAEASKRYYPSVLMRYMKFHGYKSTHDMVSKDAKMIQAEIAQYIMEDKTVARNTMQTYFAVIKNFYVQNDVLNINWKKLKNKLGVVEKKHLDQAYTSEQIKLIVDQGCPDLRAKAVVLLLASSGMRVGGLVGLQMKHLSFLEGLCRIAVYAGSKDEYIAFCSREAAKMIQAYLAYRERSGEKLAPSSPLFREQFDPSDSLRVSHPKTLNVGRFKRLVYDCIVRAGIRQVRHMVEGDRFGTVRHDVHSCHGFRKFFNTTLKNADIKPLFVELWLGHSVGLDSAYFRPSEKELLAEYMKADPLLTIDPANRLRQTVNELQKEKETLLNDLLERMNRIEKREADLDFPRCGTGEGIQNELDKMVVRAERKALESG